MPRQSKEKKVINGVGTGRRTAPARGGDAYSAPAVYVKEAGLWKMYYICRDYLGSITHITNAGGALVQELSYNAWGLLRNPATQVAYAPDTEPVLFLGRGYTGHEHLPWFGLINMNARLYDPALGRFLSPDPYVQMPDFTQNFNRYSYCLNNPLIYVDKDGEFIGTLFTITLGFTKAFVKGVILPWFVGFSDPAKAGKMFENAWKDYGKEVGRAFQIDKGLFTGNVGQIYLKWSLWGIGNTIIGNAVAHTLNFWGAIDNVTHLDGAVALSNVTRRGSAFTIGNYIFGPENFTADWRDHTFDHEYGHYIQSNWFGPFYLPVIGSTSLLSAAGLGGEDHSTRWFEVQASRMGANHFDKKYGSGKEGYMKGSPDYFDKNHFMTGGITAYLNTRTNSRYQYPHPTSGARFSIWDVLVPIGTYGVLFGGYSFFMFIF